MQWCNYDALQLAMPCKASSTNSGSPLDRQSFCRASPRSAYAVQAIAKSDEPASSARHPTLARPSGVSLRPKPNARGCSAAWRTTNCARVLDDVDQADLITAVVADKSPCPLTSLRVVDQNLLPSNAHANARSGETFSAPCSTSHFAKRFGGAQRTGNRSLLAPNPLILTQKRDYCRERSRPKSTRYDRKTG